MYSNVLYLKKMGCDFRSDSIESQLSDIGNYRVRTDGCVVPCKDGKTYFFEFTRYDLPRENSWKTHRKQKKNLLNLDLCCQEESGAYCGNWRKQWELWREQFDYTKAGILDAVNSFSTVLYTEIEFID